MPYMFKSFAVTRVSSQAIKEALVKTLSARWLMSSELPIGVAIMHKPCDPAFSVCLLFSKVSLIWEASVLADFRGWSELILWFVEPDE